MATDSQRDERQSDLAVMDANEYKQKRRLERILDALDDVQDTADEAWQLYVASEISQDALNITIQRTVKNAIEQARKLLVDHARATDDNDRYWQGNDDADALGSIRLANGTTVRIDGLQDYLESETFVTATVTETVTRRNLPNETVERTVDHTMPEIVSRRAYWRLWEFLDDVHDMEISFEELDDSPPTWGFKPVEDADTGTEDISHGDDE